MFYKVFLLKQKKFFLFSTMSQKKPKIKNLKISVESHDILKRYCNKKGIKIYKFVEQLIIDRCKEKLDIYGEN
jgi:hypothetical protein